MDIKALPNKISELLKKHRYAVLILLIGIGLMCLPTKKAVVKEEVVIQKDAVPVSKELEDILSSIDGAGDVRVFLTEASGKETIYQTNSSSSEDEHGSTMMLDTVTVSDSQREQQGLVRKVNPPSYLGAIVVCNGADRPAVRLAIVNAVAKVTGLGTDRISVMKMK